MKRVLVFGAFDGLHPGHIDFFKQAKAHGDYLIVSVGRDANVEKIKKRPALFSEGERVELVSSIKDVDEVVLGEKDDYFAGIKKIGPDVICLGYDQWASEQEVLAGLKKVGLGNVEVIRLKPHKQDIAKSTNLKKNSVDF
ncbi:FAD synthase [Candidatus Curtissbacteria bacterium]|nr:FAD synthase [Candidatus Curtissbacteria bacterium]